MILYTKREKYFDIFVYIFLIFVGFLCLYPFLYMFALAFNEGTDTLKGGITIYPRAFTLANFLTIFREKLIINSYKITILKTIIGTLSNVFITSLVAYGLTEKRLPGRKYIMIYLLIPMFFSGGLIPGYLNLKNLGLLNTFWVFIIPGIFSIWNCIVMKTIFQQIPESLKESMRIDGANELTVFFKIVVPTSLPTFAAISLFVAVAHWNDWFSGAYFVNKASLKPIQTYLYMIMTRNTSIDMDYLSKIEVEVSGGANLADYSTITSLSLKVAAVIVGTLPILIVYPFLQKYFTKGILLGSIKE